MVFIPSRETFSLSQDRLPVQTFQQFYRLLCEQLQQATSQASSKGGRRAQSVYQPARAALKAIPPRWLSVALPLPNIDPLAALEQLGGVEQQHFYWEQPSAGLAIAAADPCASVQFHGPERFRRSQAFLENCIAATVILPPLVPDRLNQAQGSSENVLPLTGPRFFCSFTFFDFAREDSRFPPATLFLPSWQVARQISPSADGLGNSQGHSIQGHSDQSYPAQGHQAQSHQAQSHQAQSHQAQSHQAQDQCSFVGHVTIQRGLPAQDDCLKLWRRYQRLLNDCPASRSASLVSAVASSTASSATVKTVAPDSAQLIDLHSPEAKKFEACVESVLQTIDQGELHKAVLACPQSFCFKPSIDNPSISALAALEALRQRHPDCHIFSVGAGAGINANSEIPSTFVGASPERLLRVQQRQLQTEAIAGSAPRGKTPEQDWEIATQLQTTPKERHEHELVSHFITEALKQLGLTPEFSRQPQVLKLSGIQHLQTPIRCHLPETIHPLEVLAKLHPTPAVAGVPQPLACEQIRQLETFERSLYASPIGWIDSQGNCDFCVGIRSALIEGDRAHLFAGAGIVKGSKPEQELQEVALKLQTLLSVLVDTAS